LTGARSTNSDDSAAKYEEQTIMASKRELIEPHKGAKRYVRDDKGHFKKEVNVDRALAADRRALAKKTVKPGQGDRGDVQR
jgi:hypothetical protein